MAMTKTTKKTKKAAKPKAKGTKKRAAADKPTGVAPRSQLTLEEAAKLDSKRKSKETKPAKPLDPNKCATPRCKGEVALTHLGRPLCQKCWERHCKSDDGARVVTKGADGAAVTATPEGEAKPKPKRGSKPKTAKADATPKRVSALDAAAEVLRNTGKAMRCHELITAMSEEGLWSSPGGKTPQATLYSAMLREIGTKGDQARFKRVDRGLFLANLETK